jgi:hypothetical protein
LQKKEEENRPIACPIPDTAHATLLALNQVTIHQCTLWKTQDLVPNLQKFNKHFNKSPSANVVITENGDSELAQLLPLSLFVVSGYALFGYDI